MMSTIEARCDDDSEDSAKEYPRDLKHLAIHVLVNDRFLVFSNIAAKEKIDLVIGLYRNNGLQLAGIRIKTSSFRQYQRGKEWNFEQKKAKHFVERTPFFYVFCLGQEDIFSLKFILVSSAELGEMVKVKNGNYKFAVSENQIDPRKYKRGRKWYKFIVKDFTRIRDELKRFDIQHQLTTT